MHNLERGSSDNLDRNARDILKKHIFLSQINHWHATLVSDIKLLDTHALGSLHCLLDEYDQILSWKKSLTP